MTTISRKEDVVYGGVTLVRVWDGTKGGPERARSLGWWDGLVRQCLTSPTLNYYHTSTGGHLFGRKVTLEVWDPSLQAQMPLSDWALAYCQDLRNEPGKAGHSKITMLGFEHDYTCLGAFSHELGHAHANWCGLYGGTLDGMDVEKLWEIEASANDTVFNSDQKPWDRPWGTGGDENGHEQYANAFRYFSGAVGTRGVSATAVEKVVPGFEDPGARQDWGTLLWMLPETEAYVRRHGGRPGTASWHRDLRMLQFQDGQGQWLLQHAPYGWRRYNYATRQWEAYAPRYTRD